MPKRTPAPAAGPEEAKRRTVERLYDALARRDGEAMAACYTADATFTDPVFVGLRGAEVGRMWRMLTAGAKDLAVTVTDFDLDNDGRTGRATVEARYLFSKTGRPVRNVIQATFTFQDGRIATQVDRFPFWRWSRQALGPIGDLLGWTPILRRKVRADARRRLDRFQT